MGVLPPLEYERKPVVLTLARRSAVVGCVLFGAGHLLVGSVVVLALTSGRTPHGDYLGLVAISSVIFGALYLGGGFALMKREAVPGWLLINGGLSAVAGAILCIQVIATSEFVEPGAIVLCLFPIIEGVWLVWARRHARTLDDSAE